MRMYVATLPGRIVLMMMRMAKLAYVRSDIARIGSHALAIALAGMTRHYTRMDMFRPHKKREETRKNWVRTSIVGVCALPS